VTSAAFHSEKDTTHTCVSSCPEFDSGLPFPLDSAFCILHSEFCIHLVHPLNAKYSAAGTIPKGTDIGHVHLKVSSIEKALDFYVGVMGFELMAMYGDSAAFISAGGYHHHIGLNTWHSRGAGPPPARSTGLYHVAIRFPSRKELASVVKRVLDAGVPLQGASDHGVSEAIYLADPDMNGIELYHDRPREEWPMNPDGTLHMTTAPLDLEALLGEAG
jgi:catechol 2,3-dioxygenase